MGHPEYQHTYANFIDNHRGICILQDLCYVAIRSLTHVNHPEYQHPYADFIDNYRNMCILQDLGYATEYQYPYVNLIDNYRGIRILQDLFKDHLKIFLVESC